MDLFMPLAALSQTWVFSLYEFLRTWRQRAKEFIKLGEQYQATKESEKKAFLESAVAKAKKREQLIHAAPTFYTDQVSRIGDPAFIAALKDYFDRTDDLFRRTETVRMPLAKHEVAKTGNQPLAAEAPTYARTSYFTGSVYWFCVLKDQTLVNVDRRELADEFLGIKEELPEEEDDVEDEVTE
jgi:hypothetical protein